MIGSSAGSSPRRSDMATPETLIVIGTSQGGLEALRTIARGLPSDFPAALVAVMHTSRDSPMALAGLIGSVSPLRVQYAKQGDRIEGGCLYIAPPDFHTVIVAPGYLRLHGGDREHFVRPAANPLFRSAAEVWGSRTIGIVLTGGLGDGTEGMKAINAAGGVGVVQEPDEAVAPSMPLTALAKDHPDHRVRLNEIAPLLVRLVAG